jgi:hypothetical protein
LLLKAVGSVGLAANKLTLYRYFVITCVGNELEKLPKEFVLLVNFFKVHMGIWSEEIIRNDKLA